jgi:hypothetical protein
MSPLLLTIVLIAFAVALGAMIMSWGSSKVGPQKSSCDRVDLVVQKAFDNDLICFNEQTGKLKIVVKNVGEEKLKSLIYRKINPDLSVRDITLPSSEMEPGRIYEAEIPIVEKGKVHIEIIPQILIDTTPTLCDDKAIIKENLQSCKLQ